MASTYSTNLKIELQGTGENAGSWGTITNTNLGTALEQAIVGLGNPDFVADANLTITLTNSNAAQVARALVLNVTSVFGSLTATRQLIVPTVEKQYLVQNNTTGGQSITVKTSAGTGITVPNGKKMHLYVDGVNVVDAVSHFSSLTLASALPVASGGTGVTTSTGTTNVVLSNSPTLVTPALGTPSSAVLTNATGLPITTGVSGLGTGVATFLATPSSANLATAVTDETGTGALVFATSPTLVTPALGTPSSGTVTNLTGTASININGTVGATTPSTGAFTTLTTSSTVTLNGGTANGVAFLNASKVLTTGSALTFDGTTLTASNSAATAGNFKATSTTAQVLNVTASNDANTTVGLLVLGSAAGVLGMLGAGAPALYTAATELNLMANNASGVIKFAAGGSSEQMRLTSTGLGIGTSSPAHKLSIQGAGFVSSSFNGQAIGDAGGERIRIGYKDGTPDTGLVPAQIIANTGLLQFASRDTAGGAITFATGTGIPERMRIDSSGNVIVGQTSSALQSGGTGITLYGSSASELKFLNSTTGQTATDGTALVASGSDFVINNREAGAITFGTSNAERARIDSSGNVGIGTSSPAAKLDVNGGALIQGLTVGRGAGAISSNTAVGASALAANTTGSNNTANGVNALLCNTTGISNTASGFNALVFNTTGCNNTANGVNALRDNTTGSSNTANGLQALFCNTTGSCNTANGVNALVCNTTGSNNTASGRDALQNNTTGCNNTANGLQALNSNTTGINNTANGVNALFCNTTGICNTANGFKALFSNTTGCNNIANGVNALQNNTTGSCNTANGVGALQNNTTGCNNTANGLQALFCNTTGSNNTASGFNALFCNTTGNSNTANGLQALNSNTTGISNTASGRDALQSNTTGSNNTASGRDALQSNTTGCFNTANGQAALQANTTGSCNTANGVSALQANTTGCSNTANGLSALFCNTTGSSNTANGFTALVFNTTGCNNTANGLSALSTNTTGSNNTANGLQALQSNTTGCNNIGIGVNAGRTGCTPAGIVNITTENDRIVIGNDAHVCAQIKIAFTATSDCRDKLCFAPIAIGLDFVRALKPTEYQFKAGGRDSTATDGKRRYGFLAQEMMPLEGADPVIISADDPNKLQYTESHLIPVLVKAMQEMSAQINLLKDKVEQLENA